MSTKKSRTSTVIGGWVALAIEAALITLLLWLGMRMLHHSIAYLTLGCFVAAALLLARYSLFGRSS